MPRLPLTLACGDYPYAHALLDGSVQPTGIELTMLPLPPAEIFWRMLRHGEFDASELSLSNYMMSVAREEERFVALPIFPLRRFRHAFIWVNTLAGIDRPEHLAGKRVGIPEYAMTALLYIRGMLAHSYGVRAQDVTWVRSRPERVRLDLPEDVHVEPAPQGSSLDEMLESGEIDAIASTVVPVGFKQGSPRIRRLFPDPRATEEAYYKETGIFPIMHVVALRREVYERHRWVAQEMAKAFQAAKDHYYRHLWSLSETQVAHPWLGLEIEEVWRFFGGDPYPYGIPANLPTLDAARAYSREQGLSNRLLTLEELFAHETLDAFHERKDDSVPTTSAVTG